VELTGSLRETLPGGSPFILPRPVLAALAVVGAVSAVLVVLHVIGVGVAFLSGRRDGLREAVPAPAAVIALAAVGFALLSVAPPAVGIESFDRYGLPLVPLVAIGVLHGAPVGRPTPRADLVTAGIALVVVGTVGAVYALNLASYDGTRWRV